MNSEKTKVEPKPEEKDIPKDLGVKVGSHEEAEWTKIKDAMKTSMQAAARQKLINERILVLANDMIKKEKLK